MNIDELKTTLKQAKPYFPEQIQLLAQHTWQALEVPLDAAIRRRRIITTERIVWPDEGVAEFQKERIVGPGPQEVQLRTAYTIVSPGTERAQLLKLPNARIDFPFHFPGYAGSGEIMAVGKEVHDLRPGDRVAGRIRHGTPEVVGREWIFPVPDIVTLDDAAWIEFGIILLQGIRKARIRPGESVLVLGQGLIGQLANRLSRLCGGAPVIASARSTAKSDAALRNGGADQFILADELSPTVVDDGFDVVIEATGDASTLAFACSQARTGGRVIVLSSPRSSALLGLSQPHAQGLTIIGAHITGVPQTDHSSGLWTYREEGELFLDLLAQKRLVVNDLITHRTVPQQANALYESLRFGDPHMIGALFDWQAELERKGVHQTNQTDNSRHVETKSQTTMYESTTSQSTRNQLPIPYQLGQSKFRKKFLFNEVPLPNDLLPTCPMRVGIVGGGDIGLRNANSVQKGPAACVAGIFDVNLEVANEMARQFDVSPSSDYESFLERDDIDAVLLSTPHMLHTPLTLQALQAGKHVLVEKPMGVNLEDATEMLTGHWANDPQLTVNYSFRYLPAVQVVRELIQDGMLGKITGIQINHLMYKGASYWSGGYTARSPANWRGSKEKAGGGILIMGICHNIDFLRYCTGLEVTRVFSEHGTFASPVEVEDAIVATCQYDNGAIGSITASTCWRGTPSLKMQIWGDHGAITLENNELSFWSERRWRNFPAGKEHQLNNLPDIDYTSTWIQRFATAVAHDISPEITAKDGWINNAVVEAIYTSRDMGRAVEVEPFPTEPEPVQQPPTRPQPIREQSIAESVQQPFPSISLQRGYAT